MIHDVEVWNEANSPIYWPARAGAPAYAGLLSRCYDVLHSGKNPANVISSTASRHDPAGFIFELGGAYREERTKRPLFDTFGHNPYPANSAEPAWTFHADSDLIGEGDYETLMNALWTAFDGTGQALPGMRGVSIWYVENGFQTVPAPDKRRYYHGRENDRHVIPAIRSPLERGQGAVDQATQLRDAVLLAYCQPAVTGYFNFGLLDKDRLGGWSRAAVAGRHRGSRPTRHQGAHRRGAAQEPGLLERARRSDRVAGSHGAAARRVVGEVSGVVTVDAGEERGGESVALAAALGTVLLGIGVRRDEVCGPGPVARRARARRLW